ncbi:MAG: aminotransferase class I/II-fold pyridoxal phosphate-dependent enzyme [Candidatus Bathyarchaeota archaeon]|nr:aminotransferase class I/II-fold pyridoxal phosphate-dependent enzyme [Candidatus Bathyarchaeota archaeon]
MRNLTNIKVTERVRTIEYAIRDVIIHARQVAKTGKKIFYLNIGDPVAFDFDTPQHIKQALIKAVEEGENAYSASEGIPELREAISQKEKRVNGVDISAEDVIVTQGISEGIQMVMAALVDAGDEILLPGPTYPPYISYAKFFGGKPVTYKTVEEELWQPDIDDLKRKVSRKTRAIAIINPNNPCGALYDEKIVKQILNLAGEHDLPVLSDEIYDQIIYEKKFVSTAHLAKDVPVIGLNGFSKAHLMTGWRLGYLYFYDQKDELKELKQCIEKEARIRLCANTPVQKAGVVALNGPQDHVKKLVQKLKQRRDYAWKRLNEIEGLSCAKPEGAFYVFPKIHAVGQKWKTDKEFVLELLKETGVLFVHGSGFDLVYGAGHVRGVFLPPIETLEEAFNEVERFMKRNS